MRSLAHCRFVLLQEPYVHLLRTEGLANKSENYNGCIRPQSQSRLYVRMGSPLRAQAVSENKCWKNQRLKFCNSTRSTNRCAPQLQYLCIMHGTKLTRPNKDKRTKPKPSQAPTRPSQPNQENQTKPASPKGAEPPEARGPGTGRRQPRQGKTKFWKFTLQLPHS